MTTSTTSPRLSHTVAVIGGATAGAEIASRLAAHGAHVAVFEMNARPYGKIEDGLPRWHVALRRKEYEVIAGKLSHPGVHFVPKTKIGRDVPLEALTAPDGFGFSTVVLACGAWRDRPLPIEGAERYVGKGLFYQNPFIIWFNHAGEKDYTGPRFVIEDDALVVGGGLASIDVVKAHMLETTRAALAKRGVDSTVLDLEVGGIPKFLEKHGLTWEELGVRPCTLFYRRRLEDMPLAEAPEGADAARLAKVEIGRRKILEKAMEKYLFHIEPLAAPEALLVENDRVVGLRFRRMRVDGKKLVPTDETFERRGSYVVSSIGSIPEPLPGLPMKGELLAFDDWDLGRIHTLPRLFGAGNVVTGKGNIVASRKHATHVAERMVAAFLGVGDAGHAGEEGLLDSVTQGAMEISDHVVESLATIAPPSSAEIERSLARIRERQQAVGFTGSVPTWIREHTPADFD